MTIVDFCGFRISVQSLLPINSKTIRYGSSDGAVNVHIDDPIARRLAEELGKELFLKNHTVEDGKGVKKIICGPADIEIHKSLDGKNYYCIDLARFHFPNHTFLTFYIFHFKRMFPPDVDYNNPNSIFYQLIRSEFLQWYQKPLSSDAFSNFAAADYTKRQNEKEVIEAIRELRQNRIPQVAKLIRADKSGSWMTRTMQQFGVNVRYLGLLRQHLETPAIQDIALTEMCARVLSSQLKHLLRETAKKEGMSRKFLFFELTAKFYNSILNDKVYKPENSTNNTGLLSLSQNKLKIANKRTDSSLLSLWSSKAAIKKFLSNKFEEALLDEERPENFDLRQRVHLIRLIFRIQEKVGVEMKHTTREKLESLGKEKLETFAFSVFDFEGFKFFLHFLDQTQLFPQASLSEG